MAQSPFSNDGWKRPPTEIGDFLPDILEPWNIPALKHSIKPELSADVSKICREIDELSSMQEEQVLGILRDALVQHTCVIEEDPPWPNAFNVQIENDRCQFVRDTSLPCPQYTVKVTRVELVGSRGQGTQLTDSDTDIVAIVRLEGSGHVQQMKEHFLSFGHRELCQSLFECLRRAEGIEVLDTFPHKNRISCCVKGASADVLPALPPESLSFEDLRMDEPERGATVAPSHEFAEIMSSTHSSPRGWDSIPPESAQTMPPSPNWQRYSHRRPPKSGRFEASSTLASSVRRVRSSERPCCPLAMRPKWPRRDHLPAWEIEGVRSRLRGGAYLGHDPTDRLQQRLDVERTGYLTFDQLRRVVRLKLRVKTSDVSNEDLANLSYMLDFEDCGMVRVDDFVSFVLAEKQVLWRPTAEAMKSKSLSSLATTQTSFGQTRGSRGRSSSRKSGDSRSPSPTASTFRPEELARALSLSRSGSPTLRGRLNVLGPLVPQELSFEEDVQRCCQSGNLGRLRVLLARSPMGQKPLSAELGCKCAHLAVHLGDEEICDLLLRAQVDPRCRAQSGATLLMRAALYGHKGIDKNLLTNWRANPMDVDEKGCNALHLACCSNLVTLQLLAEHSPRAIHATDKLGRGCFYYALANCKPDEQFRILQYLLYKRCDPNCPDDDAHNALCYALEAGNYEAVSLLLCAGADVDLSLLANHRLGSNPSNPCGCFECVARSPRDVTLGTDPDQTQGLRSLT